MNVKIPAIKLGTTRMYLEGGKVVPVTIVKVPIVRGVGVEKFQLINRRAEVKQVSLGVFEVAGKDFSAKADKPLLGQLKKYSCKEGASLLKSNVSVDASILDLVITPETFSGLKNISVSGVSKGKGYAGGMKRWGFAGKDRSHGNSVSHRTSGSIGGNQPGRVWKGKKMSGHMGSQRIMQKNVSVLAHDSEKEIVVLSGILPGYNGSKLMISIPV